MIQLHQLNFNEPPILRVENLTVYRGNYPAVREVSFELLPGTNTAVIGPNGSGKSTLIQAILDVLPRTGGQVKIFGRPIQNLGRLRQQIGYIPQHFIFDRSFPISVSELVGLGWERGRKRVGGQGGLAVPSGDDGEREPEEHRRVPTTHYPLPTTHYSVLSWLWRQNPEKEAAINAALKRVNAYQLRQQAIGTLSGGELKRVLLAYCLVMPRRLLVLDEAFAGVDVSGEADFYELLNELKREQNWTVLQVSHDIDMVSRHCDRVLCLNQTLVCSGEPDAILSPQNLLNTYGPAFSRYQHHH